MIDFNMPKQAVSLEEAASFYGIFYDKRSKKCCCLFHNDKHPSMKLNKDYFYCFSCGAHGDVINLVQQIYGLSAIEAAQKICNDFNLNGSTDTCKSPSIIKQRQQEIEHRKALERAFHQARRDTLFILHEYHSLLLSWRRDLVPTDMDLDNANPLFHEALNSFDRIDSMIDDLIYGSTEEQIEFLKFYDKEIKNIERRIEKFKTTGR